MRDLKVFDKSKHKVILISGMQWGDEGKGKLVSLLSNGFDLVARYNGGHNSGHEVILRGESFKLHLLPCGSLSPKTINVLGNGVVVHLSSLIDELDRLFELGIDLKNRLFISDRAHLIFDLHVEMDADLDDENKKFSKSLGTTKRGIGPAYSTKCSRTGIMIGEMYNWPNFEKSVTRLLYNINLDKKKLSYNEAEEMSRNEVEKHKKYFERISECIVDTSHLVREYIKEGKTVFFEGANGALLDTSFGTYPYVTSSNTTTSGVYNGVGVSPNTEILRIGVLKCYQTRIGEGPFLTELFDENFLKFQKFGSEYGVTTGRQRRCGWLDLVAAKYAQELNGFHLINLTKMDVLSKFDEIKICVNYKNKLTGNVLEHGRFPTCVYRFDDYEPIYKTFPGWNVDISECTRFEDLPQEAKDYVLFIQDELGVFIQWIGVGREVTSMIDRGKDLL